MNKSQLIDEVAEETGLTKTISAAAIDAVFGRIERSLKKGNKVTIVGFGTFGISKRKARIGRNPQTGAEIDIKAKKVVRFKSGKQLDDSVNK
jgi:DNA-binding protein HU-beta